MRTDKTNTALWIIADNMRSRKDNGEFDTYRLAYRWAVKNYHKTNSAITVSKLEKSWHKAKSRGKVRYKKDRKASVPFMITQEMRMRLRSLKYSTFNDFKNLGISVEGPQTPTFAPSFCRQKILDIATLEWDISPMIAIFLFFISPNFSIIE